MEVQGIIYDCSIWMCTVITKPNLYYMTRGFTVIVTICQSRQRDKCHDIPRELKHTSFIVWKHNTHLCNVPLPRHLSIRHEILCKLSDYRTAFGLKLDLFDTHGASRRRFSLFTDGKGLLSSSLASAERLFTLWCDDSGNCAAASTILLFLSLVSGVHKFGGRWQRFPKSSRHLLGDYDRRQSSFYETDKADREYNFMGLWTMISRQGAHEARAVP